MKRTPLVLLAALVAGPLVLLAGCDAASPDTGDGPGTLAAQKSDVCHYDADADTYHLITIADAALPAHIDHGDAGPGETVPTLEEYVFDEACQPERDSITSTFEGGIDGWTTLGDASSSITHRDDEDRTYIRYAEAAQGQHDFFVAPSEFNGDLSAFYGGSLSYELRVNNLANPLSQNDHVQLVGGGITLVYRNAAPATAGTWYSFEIGLDENAGWQVATIVGGNTYATDDTPATASDIEQVLADVTALRIRADYRSGVENIDLDDVVIRVAD